MADAPGGAIISRRDAEWFTPAGVEGREYLIVPLTFRERQAYRAALAAEGGIYPTSGQMLAAMRAAVTALAPENMADLLDAIAAAEATPDDPEVTAAVAPIEAVCASVPEYAALLGARQRFLGMMPFVAARFALRGWRGEGMPEFHRVQGAVPAALMDELPPEDIEPVGWRAVAMMQPDRAAEKNSAPPSP